VVVDVHQLVLLLRNASWQRIKVLKVSHIVVFILVFAEQLFDLQVLSVLLLGLLSGSIFPLTLNKSFLLVSSSLVDVPGFSLLSKIQDVEGVPENVFLDVVVQGRVGAEGGTVVDFKQPWLRVMVEENINAQYLEAQRVLNVERLGTAVDVFDWIYST